MLKAVRQVHCSPANRINKTFTSNATKTTF
uniref:Predicted protein n=1 Tax=Hordeum vulgare subsp. vulgare TaxID=112509 RepID=F2DF49_HORVV|nr:predicted protein [Hordeum vulgare subsp. vulgare]